MYSNQPDDVVKGIADLEPLPITATALISLLSGEDVPVSRIATLIEYDQAIAAAVLRASSGPDFGWRTPATVHEAVMRIGFGPLLDIVLRNYLARVTRAAPLYDLSEDDLWAHGAAAQLAVGALREELPTWRPAAMTATAALLHDVGKLVTSRYLKVTCADVASCAAGRGLTFVDAERRLCGTDHAEVGAAIARAWKFPDTIEHAIRRHHVDDAHPDSPMLHGVIVANLVAKTIGAGLGAEGLNLSVDASSVRRLGLTYRAFARACLTTDERLRALRTSVPDPHRAH